MKYEFNSDGSLKVNKQPIVPEPEDLIIKYWKLTHFNLGNIIKSMHFVGSLKSKRNYYFIYHHNQFYLVFTGIKDMARFNIILEEEVEEVYNLILLNNLFYNNNFSMNNLIEFLSTKEFKSKRIEMYKTAEKTTEYSEESLKDYFYYIILNICYVLVARGDLVLGMNGVNIVFYLQKNKLYNGNNIFSKIIFIGNIPGHRIIFSEGKFYFSMQCNNFRGSMVAYLIDEIKYLNQLVNECPADETLEIDSLIKKMDYYKRFHDIYNLIMDKNLRNDRDIHQYFYNRIRDALRIVALLYNNIKLSKEGRLYVFYRKTQKKDITKHLPEQIKNRIEEQTEDDESAILGYMEYLKSIDKKHSEALKQKYFTNISRILPSNKLILDILNKAYPSSLINKYFGDSK